VPAVCQAVEWLLRCMVLPVHPLIMLCSFLC
jgi:hypothetical protein